MLPPRKRLPSNRRGRRNQTPPALRPGGRSPLQPRTLAPVPPARLFATGFLTNLLNPKAAVLYLSLLPQFIVPSQGHVLMQSLVLGGSQIMVSFTFNALIAVSAGYIAAFLAGRPLWMVIQRWLMGAVLGGLAVKMLTEGRK